MNLSDNWAIVSGDVTEVRIDEHLTTIVLYVDQVLDVEGAPNLMADVEGQFITVPLPDGFSCPKVGSHIEWRIRVMNGGVFEPHPSVLAS